MFSSKVNARLEMRLIGRHDTEEFYNLVEANRDHLRSWHPWVDQVQAPDKAEKLIDLWEQQNARNRGFCSGIFYDGKLCGTIHHLNVDWSNRWTALSYWLDADHQGQGIMTTCCKAVILHGFQTWKLNRITIECAADNTKSRAIPERLGFRLEGVIRGVEWLHDRFADHAVYGLLREDCAFAA